MAIRSRLEITGVQQGHPAQNALGVQNAGMLGMNRSPDTFQEEDCGMSEDWQQEWEGALSPCLQRGSEPVEGLALEPENLEFWCSGPWAMGPSQIK